MTHLEVELHPAAWAPADPRPHPLAEAALGAAPGEPAPPPPAWSRGQQWPENGISSS